VTELISGPHQATVVRALRAWTEDADLRLCAVARRCIPPLAHVVDDYGRPLLLLALSGRPALRPDIVAPRNSGVGGAGYQAGDLDSTGEAGEGRRPRPHAD